MVDLTTSLHFSSITTICWGLGCMIDGVHMWVCVLCVFDYIYIRFSHISFLILLIIFWFFGSYKYI